MKNILKDSGLLNGIGHLPPSLRISKDQKAIE
jgi:hypothetical protein